MIFQTLSSSLALLFILMGQTAIAQAADSILSGSATVLERYFAISAADCKTIYYIPRSYVIDPERSSVLLTRTKRAAEKSTPAIDITLLLNPENTPLKAEDQDAFKAAFAETCPGATPQYAPYPAIFQNLAVNNPLEDFAIPLAEGGVRSDGAKLVHLQVDPTKIDLRSLRTTLRYFQPEVSVQVFTLQTDASVSLSVAYQAAADFAVNHFTERQCTFTQKCPSIFTFGRCSDEESCEDIPKVVQVLQDSQAASGFLFSINLAHGVPEEKIFALESELLSRLMMSLFVESSRIDMGDVLRIKYGELRKDRSGQYHDQASLIRVADDRLVGSIQIPSLEPFVMPQLKSIYRQLSHSKRARL